MLAAGLDGIRNRIDPGPPVNVNIFDLSSAQKIALGIRLLPADLNEALGELQDSEVLRQALGEHIYRHYLAAKRQVWADYSSQVHAWELDRYLATY